MDSVAGLHTNEICISDDNSIVVETKWGETIVIGSFKEMMTQPYFTDETYVTKNNVEIDMRKFINNMHVDDEMTKVIRETKQIKVEDTHPFSERLTLFYGLVYSRLQGHYKGQQPAQPSNK